MEMFKKIVSNKVHCGLDLGSQTIKASLIRGQDAENLELLGVAETRTVGLKDSSVSDLSELSECIAQTINSLSKKTNLRIKEVQLGLAGEVIFKRESNAVIPLIDSGNKTISALDVRRIQHQARLLGMGIDEEILHDFAQYFKVDDINTAINPVGLYGRKLEANFLLVISNVARIKNIIKAVNQAGLEIQNISFSSYAASEVALTKKAKTDGSILIDIGATSTNVLFFKDGFLRNIDFLPWGGNRLTESIAKHLNLSLELAEEIKKSHASVTKAGDNQEEEILVKRDKGYTPIKRDKICEAVASEIEHLMELVTRSIVNSKYYHETNAGIIMIGGGSMLPGLIEQIEKLTNLQVAPGLLTKGLNNSSVYAPVVGLAHMAYAQTFDYKMLNRAPQRWTENLSNRFKEIYQEYF